MKHPIRDRILMILCALAALIVGAASIALVFGKLSLAPLMGLMARVNDGAAVSMKIRIALVVLAVICVLIALMFISAILPAKKKRSSSFAVQKNENGMVRISLKALETLVQKCLSQHAELKVVTSSLFSDEQSVRIDVHIHLQADISMPLAISALQKQIKHYIEACSGVTVQEVRVFVDGTMQADPNAQSPYAIPSSLLGFETEALPGDVKSAEPEEKEEKIICEPEKPEEAAPAEPIAAEESADAPEEPIFAEPEAIFAEQDDVGSEAEDA